MQLSISEDPGRCPQCGGAMGVQKTAPRMGQTLSHGAFDARETIHACLDTCRWSSGALVTRRAACLSEELLPGSNVGYVLENLPDGASLVRNLVCDDYVTTVCGTLDGLAAAFAELDRQERESRLNGVPQQEQEDDLAAVLQVASASLSPADRRVVRTKEMDRRIAAAAASRAPRYHP